MLTTVRPAKSATPRLRHLRHLAADLGAHHDGAGRGGHDDRAGGGHPQHHGAQHHGPEHAGPDDPAALT